MQLCSMIPVIFFLTIGTVSLAATVQQAFPELGIYMSPRYPDTYPSGGSTTTVHNPDPNATILVHFEKLVLRNINNGVNIFKVCDGPAASSPELKYFQSNVAFTIEDLESTGPVMTFDFSSYSASGAAGAGFYATYSTVQHHHNITSPESGPITSPGYPLNYPESQAIHWTINQPAYEFVRIEIEDFQTEEFWDYLAIRDGPSAGNALIAQLSGKMNETSYTFVSSGRSIFLRFFANGYLSGRGFNAGYYPGRRYLPTAVMGDIESLDFPSNYTTYLAQQWIITAQTVNRRVLLEFKAFQTEPEDCVTIRDGELATSPIVGIYCGSELPPTFISSTNKLFVSFISHGGETNQGFFATYFSVNPADYTTTTETPICTAPEIYRIPYPGFCEKFYTCVNFRAYIEICAPGLFFDSTWSECNFPGLVDCPWFTTMATTEPPICPPEGIVYIPVPGNCAAYIICFEGIPQEYRCLNGTLYNPETRRCEPAENVECEIICPDEGLVYLPKPGSCVEYIMCAEGEAFPQRCADGTLFDPVELRCKPAEEVVCGRF